MPTVNSKRHQYYDFTLNGLVESFQPGLGATLTITVKEKDVLKLSASLEYIVAMLVSARALRVVG